MDEHSHNKTVVSFIIPAYNEENCIGKNLKAIRENHPDYPYQIIVVDNGSTDRTSEIVQSEGVCLIKRSRGTIASARNEGVRASEGQVLIFLDADVIVTPTWQEEIDKTVAKLLENPFLVIGSRCGVKDEEDWFSRYWFSRMQSVKANYINSGHLITFRKLFDHIGGFTDELRTAEDYDFCMRAKQFGAEIVNNPKLHVIHTGYPTTLKDFVARERWHGYEDFASLNRVLKSKVALVVILNIALMFCFFSLAVLNGNILYILLYFILMFILSGISTVLKFGIGSFTLLLNSSVIFYLYYFGRSLVFIDRIINLLKLKKISIQFNRLKDNK